MLRNTPIKRKLTVIILLISTAVLLITCAAFFAYDLFTFRQSMVAHLSTLAEMTASTSTAALAFDNPKDAQETLSALKAEQHIVAACLYDKDGKFFAAYPANSPTNNFPTAPEPAGLRFEGSYLVAFQPAMQSGGLQGTLYLKSDMGALYERIRLYSLIVLLVMLGSFIVAYLLSSLLQSQISQPLLQLAETAKAVSERQDYSVRAAKLGRDEFGLLTDAFNNMLEQIHNRDLALQEAQQKLRQHADDLEKRVAERTARLSETIAELEAFSYSISHDMRAPLRAMQGYSDYVMENYGEKIGPEGQQYLQRINRAGMRLDTLIQDILSYSRAARAQMDLHPVDLEKLLDDIIQQYPGFQPPQVEITIEKPLGSVIAHEASLTQVISNLLGNAIKFVQPGQTPRIKIRAEPRGDDLRLWFEDNGIGIASKDLNRIFAIFERVHAERTYEGTGIGLSIVRKAIERMGGQVGVESELGKGSKFWIQIKKS
ncbi:MAG: hypothetical protein JWQ71_2711 [Pedosphaera sp.]|nr:hypothetical protein [Pedosphaera sp.]